MIARRLQRARGAANARAGLTPPRCGPYHAEPGRTRFRRMKRRLLTLLFSLQVHRAMRVLLRRRVLVLAYHGFTDARAHPGIENSHGKHLDIQRFRQHVRYLKQRYNVIPLARLVRYYRDGEAVPPRTAVVTIDDGYQSTCELAYPVLKEYGIPATVFVTTGFIEDSEPLWTDRLEYALTATTVSRLQVTIGGQTRSYDISGRSAKLACDSDLRSRLKVVPQETRPAIVEQIERDLGQALQPDADGAALYRPLSWSQIHEMAAGGLVAIGAHTVSHIILTRCSPDRARTELLVSKQLIEQKLGAPCTMFCYPNGQVGCFDASTRAMLQELGYECGITTVFGTNGPRSDVFELKRLYFDDRGEFVRFVMTLSGVVGILDALKRRLMRHWSARQQA
jgi:peptidoglycan/xylan/chitin deacetylase (PgdA/CDA1 family)